MCVEASNFWCRVCNFSGIFKSVGEMMILFLTENAYKLILIARTEDIIIWLCSATVKIRIKCVNWRLQIQQYIYSNICSPISRITHYHSVPYYQNFMIDSSWNKVTSRINVKKRQWVKIIDETHFILKLTIFNHAHLFLNENEFFPSAFLMVL